MKTGFGKAGGGGKRSAVRSMVAISVIIRTVADTHAAALVDISETGASVEGSKLPQKGEAVDLRIGRLSAFGTIVWSDLGKCGIEFDEPLTPLELVGLRLQAVSPVAAKLSVDERIALEHWIYGGAR